MLRYQNSYKGVWLSLSHTWCAVLSPSVCPTLCDPTDCSLPGSSVHGISQARVLEWAAISFSRGSSQPRNQTWVSCTAGRFLTNWATRESHHTHSVTQLYFNDKTFSSPDSPFPDSVIVTSEACCAQPPSATQGSLPPLSWAWTCRSLSHSTEIVEAESVLDTICIWLTDFEINIEFHMFSSFDQNPCL